MALERFKEIRFKPVRREMVARANTIIREYLRAGLKMTLRQLHYQFVRRFPDLDPNANGGKGTGKAHGDGGTPYLNTQKSYQALGKTISEARLGGLVDWDALEDRGRRPTRSSQWDSITDLVESAIRGFRLPRWKGQTAYVELWVEKDALAGVLAPLASEFHAVMMVNKGYSSQSAMYEASKRFLEYQKAGKDLALFYLGDHDPSGEDMVRDIADRLKMFGVRNLEVRKLALTMDQIQQYNPPPNPLKRRDDGELADSRGAKYEAEHGDESWEVDALDPPILQQLIREAFESVVDRRKMNKVIAQEVDLRRQLKHATIKIEGGSLDDLCEECDIYDKIPGESKCYGCLYADDDNGETETEED